MKKTKKTAKKTKAKKPAKAVKKLVKKVPAKKSKKYDGMKAITDYLAKEKARQDAIVTTEMSLDEFTKKFAQQIADTADWTYGEMKQYGHTRAMADEYAVKHVIQVHEEIIVTDHW